MRTSRFTRTRSTCSVRSSAAAIAATASAAFAVVAAMACGPSEDPRFGFPGSRDISFDNAPSGGGASGSGGTGGGSTGPFPGAYDEANPPKDNRKIADVHAAANVTVTPEIDCLACHGATPLPKAPKLAFGGYAFAKGGAGPLEYGEIVVHEGNKKAVVKTSQDGFFWATEDKGPFGPNAKAAVRDKSGEVKEMQAPIGGGGGACNAQICHGNTGNRIDFK